MQYSLVVLAVRLWYLSTPYNNRSTRTLEKFQQLIPVCFNFKGGARIPGWGGGHKILPVFLTLLLLLLLGCPATYNTRLMPHPSRSPVVKYESPLIHSSHPIICIKLLFVLSRHASSRIRAQAIQPQRPQLATAKPSYLPSARTHMYSSHTHAHTQTRNLLSVLSLPGCMNPCRTPLIRVCGYVRSRWYGHVRSRWHIFVTMQSGPVRIGNSSEGLGFLG